MAPTDYILVFYSFILALAVAELLEGVGGLLSPGSTALPARIHTAWVASLLLGIVSFWWAMWQWRDIQSWTALGFLVHGSGVLLLFLMTFVTFPRELSGVDLRSYYFRIAPRVWGMWAVYFLIVIVSLRMVRGAPLSPSAIDVPNVAAIAVSLIVSRSERPAVHWIGLSLLFTTGLAFFILGPPVN